LTNTIKLKPKENINKKMLKRNSLSNNEKSNEKVNYETHLICKIIPFWITDERVG